MRNLRERFIDEAHIDFAEFEKLPNLRQALSDFIRGLGEGSDDPDDGPAQETSSDGEPTQTPFLLGVQTAHSGK